MKRIDDGALVINREKHEKEWDTGKKYVMRESSSSVYRRIRLPERADTNTINANMENGVLDVRIGLRELPRLKMDTDYFKGNPAGK